MQKRKGFTLIELLIVVVIIGILAAIAIPKFAKTKEKAYFTAMKSDLKNLATAEEEYFSDHQAYSGTISDLSTYFTPTTNVTVTPSTGAGFWTATASHSQLPTASTCAIAFGTSIPSGYPTAGEGEPVCNQ
jgi:prepilin-type N-terminal cleavage/methylation domain-containing protein